MMSHKCKFDLIVSPQAPGLFGVFYLTAHKFTTIRFVTPAFQGAGTTKYLQIGLSSVFSCNMGSKNKYSLIINDHCLHVPTGVMSRRGSNSGGDATGINVYLFEKDCVDKMSWFLKEGFTTPRMELECPWDLQYWDDLAVLHALNARANPRKGNKHQRELDFLFPRPSTTP